MSKTTMDIDKLKEALTHHHSRARRSIAWFVIRSKILITGE